MQYFPNLFISHVHERKSPIKKVWERCLFKKTNSESDWTNLSVTFNAEQSDFFYCQCIKLVTAQSPIFVQGMTLDKRHCPVARSNASQCSNELLPAPVGCKAKSSFRQRKAFGATLCSSFDAKRPPSSNKTDATAAMLISLAAANMYKLTAASSSWSSLCHFKACSSCFLLSSQPNQDNDRFLNAKTGYKGFKYWWARFQIQLHRKIFKWLNFQNYFFDWLKRIVCVEYFIVLVFLW